MQTGLGMRAFEKLLPAFINHQLANEPWALERLLKHAGAQVHLGIGPLNLRLLIDEHGHFSAGDETQGADVTLSLPNDVLPKFIFDREALFSAVRISGSADIAESLAFVLRNLRWDIEGDMAGLIGDIPARRLTRMGAGAAEQLKHSIKRAGENFVEYATEDSALLTSTQRIQIFVRDVDTLRDDVARLEKRLSRL